MNVKKIKLNKEEKEILDFFENKKFKYANNEKEKIQEAKNMAFNYIKNKKDTAISIRLNSELLKQIKINANEEGLPYQTFISSILHKYMKNKNNINKNVNV